MQWELVFEAPEVPGSASQMRSKTLLGLAGSGIVVSPLISRPIFLLQCVLQF